MFWNRTIEGLPPTLRRKSPLFFKSSFHQRALFQAGKPSPANITIKADSEWHLKFNISARFLRDDNDNDDAATVGTSTKQINAPHYAFCAALLGPRSSGGGLLCIICTSWQTISFFAPEARQMATKCTHPSWWPQKMVVLLSRQAKATLGLVNLLIDKEQHSYHNKF